MAIKITREEYEKKFGVAPESAPEKKPTFLGSIARGIVKPFAKAATSAVNLAEAATGVQPEEYSTPFSGEYLGKVERIGAGFDASKGFTPENVAALKDAVKQGVDIGLLISGGGAGKTVAKTTAQATKGAAKATAQATKGVVKKVARRGEELFVPKMEKSVENILKRTPKVKGEEMIKLAREYADDIEKMSPFEKVAGSMHKATKQLESQMKSFASQKTQLLQKARVGLDDFSTPTRDAILNARKLGDDPAITKTMDILKKVKTKIDADDAVDKIQDMLYRGAKDKTIPSGSTLQKQLKGIIGKYNTELKKSLPEAYTKLNAKVANRIKATRALSDAMGEVVEGVPTRGASLVKQFFSPSGTKVKKLFEYVKQNTGIDLASDATLARELGRIFNDPKVRSLLEGIPTSPQGAVERVLSETVNKIVGKGVKERQIQNILKLLKK